MLTTNKELKEDKCLDQTLRPVSFGEYIGQEKIKNNLSILIEAAKKRGESIDHILLYGGPGLGKCINKDSIVFTEKGMLPIGQLGNLNKKGFQRKKIKMFSNPKPKLTSHFYNNGKSKTIKIKTHQGFGLEGTPNHPIVTLDDKGNIIFKQSMYLKKGDYVAIQRGQNYFGCDTGIPPFNFIPKQNNRYNYNQYIIPTKLTPELARICGYLVGDGYIAKQSYGAGAMTFNNNNPEILEDFKNLWLKIFSQKVKIKQWGNKCPVIRVGNAKIRKFFINIDLPYSTAKNKHIPSVIMRAPREIVREFLRGYFECDACAGKPDRRVIELTSLSKRLLEEVHIVLLNFGIISRLRPRWNYEYKKDYWHLFITGSDAAIFDEEIGFISNKKTAVSQNFTNKRNTNKDLIPYGKEKIKELKQIVLELNRSLYKKHYRDTERGKISSGEMNKCLNAITELINRILDKEKEYRKLCCPKIFWDKIDSIEQGYAQTVDVAIPSNHIFFANGFVNHNTTLAHIIAKEIGKNIKITSGPAIEKVGDLASILTNLEDGDILFCDECHRLNRLIEEALYPAMEDFSLDIIIGKGPSARTLQLELPHFTFIGATTQIGAISSPLRSRFGASYRLSFYEPEEIEKIISRSARILNVEIADKETLEAIARSSRQTPRVANRLLKRVRDYSQVRADGVINKETTEQALKMLEIDQFGLEPADRHLLEAIIKKFNGGPVGVRALAASTNEEAENISDVYEPYLLQLGFLARTPRGRVATKLAYQHLGIKLNEEEQKILF